jgi:hypothetical protein
VCAAPSAAVKAGNAYEAVTSMPAVARGWFAAHILR